MVPRKFEEVIGIVYKIWKEKHSGYGGDCPQEETLASFFEGKLPDKESLDLKKHFLFCDRCSELLALLSEEVPDLPIPDDLEARTKDIIGRDNNSALFFLEVILGLKKKTLDLISTTGDILFGQEFIPLPVLRSRNKADFGDEVIIVKALSNLKIELELENKTNYLAKVIIRLTDITTGKPVEGLRVTLYRNSREIESYIAEAGKAVFDNIAPDKYTLEIFTPENTLGKAVLDIRKI